MWWRAFLLIVLSRCGLVSGLDTLHVDASAGDASGDATGDTSDDGVADVAIGVDATTDTAGIQCGSTTCAVGSVCCINPNDLGAKPACAQQGCPGGDIALQCDDKSDCPNDSLQTCCFTSMAGSQCGSGGSVGCAVLCKTDGQCAVGLKCGPFDAGYGLSLSKCQ